MMTLADGTRGVVRAARGRIDSMTGPSAASGREEGRWATLAGRTRGVVRARQAWDSTR